MEEKERKKIKMKNSEWDRDKERRRKYKKKFQAPEEKVYIWLKWWTKFCVSVIKIFCSLVFYIVIYERYFSYYLDMLCNEQNKA